MAAGPLERAIRADLERIGLLLLQDPKLPSLATMVARRQIKGSWWGDPAGKEIFRIASALDDDPDIVTAKLVAGKVTFVHRSLFAALVAVGSERARWQIERLARPACELLARVDESGAIRASGTAAKELERRLLVASRQVHTDAGAHVTELIAWNVFARQVRAGRRPTAERGRRAIEEAAERLAPGRGRALLPWLSST